MKWLFALISFVIGVVVSGLVWDEINHQLIKHGWTKRVCSFLITLGCQLYPANYRAECREQAVATVAELLGEKRHLASLKVSASLVATKRGFSLLVIFSHMLASFGQLLYFGLPSDKWADASLSFIPELATPSYIGSVLWVIVMAASKPLSEEGKILVVPLKYKFGIAFFFLPLLACAIVSVLILLKHGYPSGAILLAYNFLLLLFLVTSVCFPKIGKTLFSES